MKALQGKGTEGQGRPPGDWKALFALLGKADRVDAERQARREREAKLMGRALDELVPLLDLNPLWIERINELICSDEIHGWGGSRIEMGELQEIGHRAEAVLGFRSSELGMALLLELMYDPMSMP